jgi:transcriptional regulator with XRE-family HTH domain
MKDISARLKNIRESKKMTRKTLAKKAGVSGGHISQIENHARNPSIGIFMKICSALDVSPWEVLVEPGEEVIVPLSKEEITILRGYKNSPKNVKAAIHSLLKTDKT